MKLVKNTKMYCENVLLMMMMIVMVDAMIMVSFIN